MLTVRTQATPRHAGFIGQHGPGPVALRTRDGNRRLWNRHGMQSSESMRRRAVHNCTGRKDTAMTDQPFDAPNRETAPRSRGERGLTCPNASAWVTRDISIRPAHLRTLAGGTVRASLESRPRRRVRGGPGADRRAPRATTTFGLGAALKDSSSRDDRAKGYETMKKATETLEAANKVYLGK
jgi:hypothetical protein